MAEFFQACVCRSQSSCATLRYSVFRLPLFIAKVRPRAAVVRTTRFVSKSRGTIRSTGKHSLRVKRRPPIASSFASWRAAPKPRRSRGKSRPPLVCSNRWRRETLATEQPPQTTARPAREPSWRRTAGARIAARGGFLLRLGPIWAGDGAPELLSANDGQPKARRRNPPRPARARGGRPQCRVPTGFAAWRDSRPRRSWLSKSWRATS